MTVRRRYRRGECNRCGSAAIVLASPGLSVILEAIDLSRKIFRRMKNYVIYRIACTLQLLVFSCLATLCVDTEVISEISPMECGHPETSCWQDEHVLVEMSTMERCHPRNLMPPLSHC